MLHKPSAQRLNEAAQERLFSLIMAERILQEISPSAFNQPNILKSSKSSAIFNYDYSILNCTLNRLGLLLYREDNPENADSFCPLPSVKPLHESLMIWDMAIKYFF